jgi:hypothetical protein
MRTPARRPWHRDSLPVWAWAFLGVARFVALVLAMLPFALIAATWWWWTHPPDPAMEVIRQSSPLVRVERRPAPERGTGLERWRLALANGDTVHALWRPAPGARDPAARPWTVVLLGGIGTDDRAALLVPDAIPAHVLAVSWPWRGPRRMSPFEFVARAPAIRRALLHTPAAIAAGVWAVRREVPGTRVAVLGASLGAPPTAAALRLAEADAMVLVDGAADLETLLRSEVARAVGGGAAGAVLGPPLGSLAARLLAALDPAHHGEAARHTPVLLVDAAAEDRYPLACVRRLHAAYPAATRTTHPGAHLRPENTEQVASIVGSAWNWLAALPDTTPREAP